VRRAREVVVSDDVERWPRWGAWAYALLNGNPRSNREVVARAGPRAGLRVLDVGCGPGAAVRRAADAGADAIGVDPSPAMVDIATRRSRRHPTARFAVGHAADLPVDDAGVDVVWTIASLHNWPDVAAGLSELRRVLAPGGRLLVGERRLRSPGGHGMSPDEAADLCHELEEHGFADPMVSEVRLWPFRMVLVEARA
jgi:ubiquinone/menaquinone biosynthesis C-methylase UbiE